MVTARRLRLRIIPADAGSTPKKDEAAFLYPDHPRGCGEHIMCILYLASGLGSSPRMRGALLVQPLG